MRVYVVDENIQDANNLAIILKQEFGSCLTDVVCLSAWHQFEKMVNFVDSRNLVISPATLLNSPNVESFVKKLNQNSCPVVVYSKDTELCIRAIKYGIFDYILMPFNVEDICACLKRVEKKLNGNLAVSNIVLRDMKGSQVIPIHTIRYIEANGAYSKVYCSDKDLLVCRTLKSFEDEFKEPFIRIHRSFMVNINFIEHFKLTELSLTLGTKLPVSKVGRTRLLTKIPQFNYRDSKL